MSEFRTVPHAEAAVSAAHPLRRHGPTALAATGAVAGAGLTWLGGPLALLGALACLVSAAWWTRRTAAPRATDATAVGAMSPSNGQPTTTEM